MKKKKITFSSFEPLFSNKSSEIGQFPKWDTNEITRVIEIRLKFFWLKII